MVLSLHLVRVHERRCCELYPWALVDSWVIRGGAHSRQAQRLACLDTGWRRCYSPQGGLQSNGQRANNTGIYLLYRLQCYRPIYEREQQKASTRDHSIGSSIQRPLSKKQVTSTKRVPLRHNESCLCCKNIAGLITLATMLPLVVTGSEHAM